MTILLLTQKLNPELTNGPETSLYGQRISSSTMCYPKLSCLHVTFHHDQLLLLSFTGVTMLCVKITDTIFL